MCVKERAASAALHKLKVFAALNQMQNVIRFPNWKKFGEPGFILLCQHWVFLPSGERWTCVPHSCQSKHPELITRLINDGLQWPLVCPGVPALCFSPSQGALAALQSQKNARNSQWGVHLSQKFRIVSVGLGLFNPFPERILGWL